MTMYKTTNSDEIRKSIEQAAKNGHRHIIKYLVGEGGEITNYAIALAKEHHHTTIEKYLKRKRRQQHE